MNQRLRLDGVDHDIESLGSAAQQILERLRFVQQRLQELHDQQALLTKAKRAYIADLKMELVRAAPVTRVENEKGGGPLVSFLRDDDIDSF